MNRKWWIGSGLILVVLAGISFLVINNVSQTKGPEYQNPIFEPVIADPSIVEGEDGYYYVYGTEDNWGDGMGARVVPIVRSKDLVEWEYAGEAFTEKPAWKEEGEYGHRMFPFLTINIICIILNPRGEMQTQLLALR